MTRRTFFKGLIALTLCAALGIGPEDDEPPILKRLQGLFSFCVYVHIVNMHKKSVCNTCT